MPIEGVDYSWGRPGAAALIAAGKQFACRYLSPDTTGKNLSAAEAIVLSTHGIKLVANWEWQARDALGSEYNAITYARDADAMAHKFGMPKDRPIYFSVDFDVQGGQYKQVAQWFKWLALSVPVERLGAYGGYGIIKYLFDRDLITWGWQTYAWSYGKWDSRAHLRQYLNGQRIGGADVDLDYAMKEDYGGWLHRDVEGAPSNPLDAIDQRADAWDYNGIMHGVASDHAAATDTIAGLARSVLALRS